MAKKCYRSPHPSVQFTLDFGFYLPLDFVHLIVLLIELFAHDHRSLNCKVPAATSTVRPTA